MENDIWRVPESAEDVSGKVAALGPPQAEFAITPGRFFQQILGALLLLPLGLALVVLPIMMFWYRPGDHGWFLAFKLSVIGFIFLSGSVFLAQRAVRNRGLRVMVYPEGLVRVHRDQAQAIFWDEVEHLVQKRPTGAWGRMSQGRLLVTLKRSDGSELTFDDSLPDLHGLAVMMYRETLRHMLPRVREVIESGGAVTFGKLVATSRGVSNGRETVSWELARPPRLEGDRFYLDKQGSWLPWHNGSLSETPNFHVLQALLREQQIGPARGQSAEAAGAQPGVESDQA
jgi:hypothetical protein